MMFEGLTSRCTTPCSCAVWRARATLAIRSATASTSSRPLAPGGPQDHAHAAAPDLAHDAERADARGDRELGRRLLSRGPLEGGQRVERRREVGAEPGVPRREGRGIEGLAAAPALEEELDGLL